MAGFFKLSNSKTMKETEMILVAIIIILIFFQTNNKTIILDIVRELGWISKWVCGHDKMNPKTDNSFNDPFGVGTLIFQVRGEIFSS